jgi:uncharacterized protein (DUF885 family)
MCPAFGQAASVADRVAEQNALFEDFYQTGLKNFPERATSYGDYRYNSQLNPASLADISRQHAEADGFLARLKAIPTDGMSDKDLLSHRILEHQLEREDVNYSLKNYEMPVNQQNGVHTRSPIWRTRCRSIPCPITRITSPGYTKLRARWNRRPR